MPLGSDANTEIAKSAQTTIDEIEKWTSISKQSDLQEGN